jgi:hypothetical protein
MVHWWDANVEPVTQYGSYNYRPIRGSTTTLSNHSSGTAIDINWDKRLLAETTYAVATGQAVAWSRLPGTLAGRAGDLERNVQERSIRR